MTTYQITGPTYEFRALLTRLGLQWNATEKAWETSDRQSAEKAVNPTYAGRKAGRLLKLTVVNK